MADIVNLRQFKKRKERTAKAKTADERAALFGRTKAEKLRDESSRQKLENHLDQHKRDGEE